MRRNTSRGTDFGPPRRPGGGFVLVPLSLAVAAWDAYRTRRIGVADLRAWLAAWEVRARRCRSPLTAPPRFRPDEWQALTGASPRRLRASLRRLAAAELITWPEPATSAPDPQPPGRPADAPGVAELLDRFPNPGRRLPVPRRLLRFLARGARPALIATALGHVAACLYHRRGAGCSARGRCKASWVAHAFGVDHRAVKRARRQLVDLGWLVPLGDRQVRLNRWGAHLRVELDWAPPAADGRARRAPPTPRPELPPPGPANGPELPPPLPHKEPLPGDDHQEPAPRGPAGVYTPQPVQETSAPPPRLRDITVADLKDTARLLELGAQARAAGLLGASEHDGLEFAAAAAHAVRVGTRNPPGLLYAWLQGKNRECVTQADEDAARARLRRHAREAAPVAVPPARRSPAGAVPGGLSPDAEVVRAVREAVSRSGVRVHPFPQLRRVRPDWTRERYDRAEAELEGWLRHRRLSQLGHGGAGPLSALGALPPGALGPPGVLKTGVSPRQDPVGNG